MQVDSEGKVVEKHSAAKIAKAAFELAKKSPLLADQLMVTRRETTTLDYLSPQEKAVAEVQWKQLRTKVLKCASHAQARMPSS